jgi:phosphatidate cytidylyltransferase
MISNNLKQRAFTSLVLLTFVFLIFSFNIFLIYFLIIMGVLSILEFIQIINIIFKNKFRRILINLFFIIYIFIFCILFFLLSNLEGLKLILFILLLSCVASDIGGYILGKIFKGPKITKISPKKTYAGAVGSFLFTLIIMYLFSFYFIDLQIYKIIFISFMTSLFCQLGDLFFSLLKRKAKLKDTGKTLPGHGGVIDRLDGIFLGIPVGFVSLTLLY